MGFLTALFEAIAAVPVIGGYIREIALWVAKQVRVAQRRRDRARLERGIEDAKTDGNTCELERAFNPDLECTPPKRE